MGAGPQLRTERLLLRRWIPSDRAPFARLNRDPRVVEFLGPPFTRAQSNALADRIEAEFDERGFGLWAVEVPGISAFVGFVGLSVPRFEAPFMPAVELGWRLASDSWGRGYATEGARVALAFGFDVVGLSHVVSFTAAGNVRSRRVMERIGMTHDPTDDFDHPGLAPGDPLRRHVLYRARPIAVSRR